MQPVRRRRMNLSRTTVRALTGHQLGQANGGFRKSDFDLCGGNTDFCIPTDDCTSDCPDSKDCG